MQIRGSSWVNARATGLDRRRAAGSLDVVLKASEVTLGDAVGDADCSWAHADAVHIDTHLQRSPRGRVSGRLDGSADSAAFHWGDLRLTGNARVHAVVEPTAAPDGTESRVEGTVRALRVRMKSGGGAPKRWSAAIPDAKVEASLTLDRGRFEGPIEIAAKRVRAVVGNVSMRSDVRARLRVKPMDLGERSGTVSGLVEMRNASLWSGDQRVDGWWAKIGISPTRIVANEYLDIDGRVSARFRDGLPGLLTLSEADEIPGWLPDFLPLNGLVGTLDVRRRCQLMDIGISHIVGGPLVARGRIQNVPGDTRGAVLVRHASMEFVSAGMSLGERGDGLSLFAGEGWLAKQFTTLDREAVLARLHSCDASPKQVCD